MSTVCLVLWSSSCALRNSCSKEWASSLNSPTSSQFFRKRVGVGVWSEKIRLHFSKTWFLHDATKAHYLNIHNKVPHLNKSLRASSMLYDNVYKQSITKAEQTYIWVKKVHSLTCYDDRVSPGRTKFQRHFMFVFVD